jgi:hypothetical protein
MVVSSCCLTIEFLSYIISVSVRPSNDTCRNAELWSILFVMYCASIVKHFFAFTSVLNRRVLCYCHICLSIEKLAFQYKYTFYADNFLFYCPVSFSNTESHLTTCEDQCLIYACSFMDYLRTSYASNRILVTKTSITTGLAYV